MTSSADQHSRAGRALLAAGTASYDCAEAFPALDGVPESLRTVVEALKGLGFTTVARSPGYRLDLAPRSLSAAVREAATAAPVVVVYYTGHGADLDRGTYYLVGKNSNPADLVMTALAARDLLELITVRDEHGELLDSQPTVLVILDCCYSGSAGMGMLRDALEGIGNSDTWVIASAGPLEYARQGVFARALRDALERPLTGPSQRFISLDSLVQAINDANAGRAGQQARVFPPPAGSTGVPPFFPNRGYVPGLAGLTVDEQHWLSRVRGGPEETTAGSYVTGRDGRMLAAEHLVGWMTGPGPGGLAVVTGSPGTGKSTLLSLPVLLTRQARREDLLHAAGPGSLIGRTASLLPAGTPLVAVHARGLNADQAAGIVARALGRDAASAKALLEDLDATPVRGSQVVVVVDAADEAASPAALLGGLVVPLARRPGLRVVVGARRHVLPQAASADLVIDLDTREYRDPLALTDYVHQLLVADEEPGVTTAYQQRPGGGDQGTARVAEAIARRATAREGMGAESFLLARLFALSVRSRTEPADVTSPDWQAGLPASIAEAFDEDLARLGGQQPAARALLSALAWAKGPGLPWENIWAPVAQALAGPGAAADSSVTSEDARWLLTEAGAYIVEDLGAGGRSVYRPFHDLLAAHLRGQPTTEQLAASPAAANAWEQRRTDSEAVITSTLLATIPAGPQGRPDWLAAHPYLRTYLAQHAAAVGTPTLADLVQDTDYLSVADPLTLTPLLSPAIPELRATARAYRHARPLLGDDARANTAYLLEAIRALTGATTPARD